MKYNTNQFDSSFKEFSGLSDSSEKKIPVILTIDSYLKANNYLLKRYIDDFIISPKVIVSYNGYLRQQEGHNKGNMNDMLRFFIKTFQGIKLREHERDLFECIKDYELKLKQDEDTLKNYFANHTSPLNIVQKVIQGRKLLNFVKKYMGFIINMKSYFHYLDYEPTSFDKTPIDEEYYKISHKNDINELPKQNKLPPITVVLGNDGKMTKPIDTATASDIIQMENIQDVYLHPNHLAITPDDETAAKAYWIDKQEKEKLQPFPESPIKYFGIDQFSKGNQIQVVPINQINQARRTNDNKEQTLFSEEKENPITPQIHNEPKTELDNNNELESKTEVNVSQQQEVQATKQNPYFKSLLVEQPIYLNYDSSGIPTNVHILKAPEIVKANKSLLQPQLVEEKQPIVISQTLTRRGEASPYFTEFTNLNKGNWQQSKENLSKTGIRVPQSNENVSFTSAGVDQMMKDYANKLVEKKPIYTGSPDVFKVRKLLGKDPIIAKLDNVYKQLFNGQI